VTLRKAGTFFDYGISGDQPWLRSDAKKIGITLDQGMGCSIFFLAFSHAWSIF